MCLYTVQNKKIILDKDIFVYKTCDVNNENKLCARYVNHYYSIIEKAPIRVTDVKNWRGERKITSGLHARILDLSENDEYDKTTHNTEWIIPRGSKVYYGDNNDIVSNKMIFNRLLNSNETNYKLVIPGNNINWAKPSIIRFVKKWYRWFKNDY